ncbi:hypothetical protein ACVW1A_001519 [Bradyrhizobium sp. LB1.3]
MSMMTLSQSEQPVSGGFRVDVSRGQRIGRVSSEWFSRPDDERYLNLPDLYNAVRSRAECAQARTVESRAIRVEANSNNSGDTRWKVPGVLDWSTMTHNPFVEVTKDTTTLYASDRDVFLFLVDDTNPIEAGRLRDGSPDLYFRGFYCWNSEVGSKTLGIASFYLRAVCMNRNLWGVENFEQITIRHSKFAAQRFAHEAAPALTSFANSSPAPFVAGIKAARERIVARTDEDRENFLRKGGFSKSETTKIIETVLGEENRKPESIFDFVQGITALARTKSHQDARLELEGKAKRLMERAI